MSELSEFERRQIILQADKAFAELKEPLTIPLILDGETALILIAQLQLALRHPGNVGPSSKITREIVDGLISRMPEGTRKLLELGFDARYDG